MFATTLMASPRRRRISLTALIDVVFILLMFFMLTSTFSQWRAIELNAPVASTDVSDSKPQLLILAADGSLQLHGSDRVVAHIAALESGYLDAARPVVVLAQADATVQLMVAALEQLKLIGLQQVTLGGALPGPDSATAQKGSLP